MTNGDVEHMEDGNVGSSSGSSTKPPTKRSRKAINCAPCRNSKLKCDKARPCSSCVLRGTASQCYMDEKDETSTRRVNGIDPHNEIARMRQALAALESYVIRGPGARAVSSAASKGLCAPDGGTNHALKHEPDSEALTVPGVLAEKGKGGFYAGPTSTATLLFSLKAATDVREVTDDYERISLETDSEDTQTDISRGFDDDLLAQLPAIHIIDGLVDFYLSFCNWMYRHIHPESFKASWSRFKEKASANRLTLATLSLVMAVAVRYLPEGHALLTALQHRDREEVGELFHHVACEALSRYRTESRSLSLELVELLLIRTHYLTLSKNESEEIWSIRGELVAIGTAMGLHRDPEKWKMSRELAERRRWAWWHIILLERWQCFLFGRPLSVASHHFDTRMPSYVSPNVDKTGRLFLPNIHMFRLADILGDIVDDAVSVRAVPYSRVMEHDKDLCSWLEDLPKELDLDEYRLARSLASPDPADTRLGVLSLIIRTSYYHIRFTLHRPYAAAPHDNPSKPQGPNTNSSKSSSFDTSKNQENHARMAQSLDTAASAADKLIQLVAQARPEVIGNSTIAPVHVHWGPFHCFSAAMFFSLQLIADPHQPGASLFRANIRRVLDLLDMSQGVAIADKAGTMLRALRPLYDGDLEPDGKGEGRSKEQVIALVKSLAFPYYDSQTNQYSRPYHVDSPHSSGGPASPVVSRQNTSNHSSPGDVLLSSNNLPSLLSPIAPRPPISIMNSNQDPIPYPGGGSRTSVTPDYYSVPRPQIPGGPALKPTPSFNPGNPLVQGSDMWGASVGFGQGEWARFLDVMQRTEASGLLNPS